MTYAIVTGVRWFDILAVMDNEHARAKSAGWDFSSAN